MNQPHIRPRPGASSIVWLIVLLAAVLVATTVGALRNHRNANSAASADSAAASAVAMSQSHVVSPQIMSALENIPEAAWQQAGTNGASPPEFVGGADSANGKPVVLYVGAGYCPYCAAIRWSMVAALSRFGKFSDLRLGRSASEDVYPNTPTFSFYQSSYTSAYVVFESVEKASNIAQPDGNYAPLEQPTSAQQALFKKYDGPPYVAANGAGGIPFLLVGGKFLWSGSPFDPGLLAGKSQDAIAAALAQASDEASTAILSNANVITATICAVDGEMPTEVCSTPVIQNIVHELPQATR